MATKIQEYTVDDLALMEDPRAEVPADQTIHFAVDGKDYVIDLTQKHASGFFAAIAPYQEAARRVKSTRPVRTSAARSSAARIREWAKERGIDINEKGRIPRPVRERYDRELQPV